MAPEPRPGRRQRQTGRQSTGLWRDVPLRARLVVSAAVLVVAPAAWRAFVTFAKRH
ncbi:hypothetical protein [Micromonospora sp. ALFpr18c]|uniref:hypothetical protein n=1 Tax=unclassified Micromonospora TaxID=2617518 RepID=UPI001788B19D|nr:hypothetical protein [Micromonospora sp. ALFpr18c]